MVSDSINFERDITVPVVFDRVESDVSTLMYEEIEEIMI